MKCPKCQYLGFETGDRCKNCGYDFSLIAPAPIAFPDPDLTVRTDDAETGAPEIWLDRLDRTMDEAGRPDCKQEHLIGVREPEVTPAAAAPDPTLPLFNPNDPDDIPLIALPAVPRPPLAVRRRIDTPRLRAVPKMAHRHVPALDFREEVPPEVFEDDPDAQPDAAVPGAMRPTAGAPLGRTQVGGRRLAAATIDHAILFAIDLAVWYFTLRMAGIGTDDYRLLPAAPMLTFLAILKISYFTAFTAIGGQTIGKMALGIAVVADRGVIDSGRALRRTLAGLLSLAPLGLGFLPAFFGADRRALHDRLTGTRVVGLPSA